MKYLIYQSSVAQWRTNPSVAAFAASISSPVGSEMEREIPDWMSSHSLDAEISSILASYESGNSTPTSTDFTMDGVDGDTTPVQTPTVSNSPEQISNLPKQWILNDDDTYLSKQVPKAKQSMGRNGMRAVTDPYALRAGSYQVGRQTKAFLAEELSVLDGIGNFDLGEEEMQKLSNANWNSPSGSSSTMTQSPSLSLGNFDLDRPSLPPLPVNLDNAKAPLTPKLGGMRSFSQPNSPSESKITSKQKQSPKGILKDKLLPVVPIKSMILPSKDTETSNETNSPIPRRVGPPLPPRKPKTQNNTSNVIPQSAEPVLRVQPTPTTPRLGSASPTVSQEIQQSPSSPNTKKQRKKLFQNGFKNKFKDLMQMDGQANVAQTGTPKRSESMASITAEKTSGVKTLGIRSLKGMLHKRAADADAQNTDLTLHEEEEPTSPKLQQSPFSPVSDIQLPQNAASDGPPLSISKVASLKSESSSTTPVSFTTPKYVPPKRKPVPITIQPAREIKKSEEVAHESLASTVPLTSKSDSNNENSASAIMAPEPSPALFMDAPGIVNSDSQNTSLMSYASASSLEIDNNSIIRARAGSPTEYLTASEDEEEFTNSLNSMLHSGETGQATHAVFTKLPEVVSVTKSDSFENFLAETNGSESAGLADLPSRAVSSETLENISKEKEFGSIRPDSTKVDEKPNDWSPLIKTSSEIQTATIGLGNIMTTEKPSSGTSSTFLSKRFSFEPGVEQINRSPVVITTGSKSHKSMSPKPRLRVTVDRSSRRDSKLSTTSSATTGSMIEIGDLGEGKMKDDQSERSVSVEPVKLPQVSEVIEKPITEPIAEVVESKVADIEEVASKEGASEEGDLTVATSKELKELDVSNVSMTGFLNRHQRSRSDTDLAASVNNEVLPVRSFNEQEVTEPNASVPRLSEYQQQDHMAGYADVNRPGYREAASALGFYNAAEESRYYGAGPRPGMQGMRGRPNGRGYGPRGGRQITNNAGGRMTPQLGMYNNNYNDYGMPAQQRGTPSPGPGASTGYARSSPISPVPGMYRGPPGARRGRPVGRGRGGLNPPHGAGAFRGAPFMRMGAGGRASPVGGSRSPMMMMAGNDYGVMSPGGRSPGLSPGGSPGGVIMAAHRMNDSDIVIPMASDLNLSSLGPGVGSGGGGGNGNGGRRFLLRTRSAQDLADDDLDDDMLYDGTAMNGMLPYASPRGPPSRSSGSPGSARSNTGLSSTAVRAIMRGTDAGSSGGSSITSGGRYPSPRGPSPAGQGGGSPAGASPVGLSPRGSPSPRLPSEYGYPSSSSMSRLNLYSSSTPDFDPDQFDVPRRGQRYY
ncbi:uncharacterized protein V1516DRAFT_538056 [Lipomyces oligophaga]|uniref:uncharacterized protein n=1 Tax=Lipomyces oligophaga TaxID=45792 RepID=UPI0034CED1DB